MDEISFDRDLDSAGLWCVDTLGTRRELLITGAYVHGEISASGEWLVFSTGQIFKARLAAGGIDSGSIQLLTAYGKDFYPAWGPGDSLIAFDSNRGGAGTYGIWCLDVESGAVTQVVAAGRSPDWFPDGRTIAFHAVSPVTLSSEIFTHCLDTGVSRQLTENAVPDTHPQVSPDGSLILFTRALEVWIMNADGTDKRFVIDGSDPSWAPDGVRFAFLRRKVTVPYNWGTIWMSDTSGTTLVQLTPGLN